MVYALPDGSNRRTDARETAPGPVSRLPGANPSRRDGVRELRGLRHRRSRHPTQLKDRDPDAVLEKGEVGLLFICTNCGGFVAAGDSRCSRCSAEFEPETEEIGPAEEDIL